MTIPDWARWPDPDRPAWTLGVEEEVMLLDAETLALAPAIEEVLDALPQSLRERVTSETHSSALEMATGVHPTVDAATSEMARLRSELANALEGLGLRAASAGTHPTATWEDVVVAPAQRHREVEEAMRALARREPTFALHVHVGVPTPAGAIGALNQVRAHLPLLLALSGNSPFWQGRDSGLASARTPLFQAFPRVGIPRAYASYAEWAHAVDLLVRCDALPDHTHLWWDVRLNPALGTVEVRVMDAQTEAADSASLVALVQCLVRLEVVEGSASWRALGAREVLEENRFLAARDGTRAELLDLDRENGGRVPVRALAEELLDACAPHASALGCTDELERVHLLLDAPGAQRQRDAAGPEGDHQRLLRSLADAFCARDGTRH